MKGAKAIAGAFLVFVLSGCAPILDVKLAPDWPEADVVGIRQAATDWNAITNADHKLTFDGDSWYVAREDPGVGFNGLTSRSKRRVQIRPEPIGKTIYEVAKHEFGHVLGLRHLCGGNGTKGESIGRDCIPGAPSLGVMDPINPSQDFSPEDLSECRDAGVC